MDNIPSFTATENLNRVLMDENAKHLIVEGPMDLPIYSELIEILTGIHDIHEPPLVVFGGGKERILKFLQDEDVHNAKVILDMDFDNPNDNLGFDNVYSLRKYSIENYAFDELVLVNLISHLLKVNPNDVRAVFNLNELRQHWLDSLSSTIPVVYYYQKIFEGNKSKWSNVFINQGGSDWKLCTEQLDRFRGEMLDEMVTTQEQCEETYLESFCSGLCPSISFPGKILLESLHRYLRMYCNAQRIGSYSIINSKNTLLLQLIGRMIKNEELENIILNAVA
jgi:hypothetical protein